MKTFTEEQIKTVVTDITGEDGITYDLDITSISIYDDYKATVFAYLYNNGECDNEEYKIKVWSEEDGSIEWDFSY